jgi:3-hydroxyisobutyrate dehydrogenase-like beta-hydroxyacid dehydrogenase
VTGSERGSGTPPLRIAVLGLGEAGSRFAEGLAKAAEVRGYDPAGVPDPPGVIRCAAPGEAVAGADVVIAVTHAAQALDAAGSAVGQMREGSFYADFATGDAGLKRELASQADSHGLRFVDGAIMNPVPLRGVATRVDLSGTDAGHLAGLLIPLGMTLEVVGAEPGIAATRKLLRSIVVKGISALAIESLRAAERAEMADWFRGYLVDVLTGMDKEFITRLVDGTRQHSERRIHEMEAAATLLRQLGEAPLTVEATREVLASVPERGIPGL